MDSLTRRSLDFAENSANAGIDAAVTIAARTPGLFHPSRENGREAQRMVEEKIRATYEGALGAALAWNRFLIRTAFGGLPSPNALSHALVDVAEAAMAPSRRTVRANAKRLTSRARAG
jgi:hypothetical protein